MTVPQAHGSMKHKDGKTKASLYYIAKPCLKESLEQEVFILHAQNSGSYPHYQIKKQAQSEC